MMTTMITDVEDDGNNNMLVFSPFPFLGEPHASLQSARPAFRLKVIFEVEDKFKNTVYNIFHQNQNENLDVLHFFLEHSCLLLCLYLLFGK